jgi:hypothetical protein
LPCSALVMAGVHGSEFFGVDVAYALKVKLDSLNPESFKWKIVIIPELFVDNVQMARSMPIEESYYRCTCTDNCTPKVWNCDPNRQMPKMNRLFDVSMLDALGRNLEVENQHLLQFVQVFNPSRIASIHCNNTPADVGIYADPRVNENEIALGFSIDRSLAINMAMKAEGLGGKCIGNKLQSSIKNAIYPRDLRDTAEGKPQRRNYNVDSGRGISFGTWASTEINKDGANIKKAATVITMELPQFRSFYSSSTKSLNLSRLYSNTNAYVKSLLEVFLLNQ